MNLAGVEIVLNMRDKMDRMQEEINAFLEFFLEQLQKQGVSQGGSEAAGAGHHPQGPPAGPPGPLDEGDGPEK